MTHSISKNDYIFICDWLERVKTQYDEATPKRIKEADYDRAKQSFPLGNTTNNYFFSPPQPTYGGFYMDNSTTSQNITNVYHHSVDSSKDKNSKTKEEEEKTKTKEEKTNWGAIAAIGVVSTSITGICLFVYARLSKAAEGARNYLENTKKIAHFASFQSSNKDISEIAGDLSRIANVQRKIDQRAADKIKIYKYSVLTGLVGTLAMAAGGITIFAAAPALATAATTAVVVGGILNLIAGAFAIYNCGDHWSDEKEGQKEFSTVQESVSNVSNGMKNLRSSQLSGERPPHVESEAAIRNQRANFSNIYPNLSHEFMYGYEHVQASAPSLF